MDVIKIQEVATKIADKRDTDVILYNGPIERPLDRRLMSMCDTLRQHKNVALFLCTSGGDASAAYRIARYMQRKYTRFTIYICGSCKSAGTLIAVGAHEMIIHDLGELGPLDVQLGKKDEIWETDSGLTVLSAIKALEEKAFDLFENCFLSLKRRSGGRITLKTATELASKLAVGTMTPIIAQIDPIHVGEVSRAMNIGVEYANRLAKFSRNVGEKTISALTNSYPSHGFVIDREEASELFVNVRTPDSDEAELIRLLENTVVDPTDQPVVCYLSQPKKEEEQKHEAANNGEVAGEGAPAAGVESGEAAQPVEAGGAVESLSAYVQQRRSGSSA